MSDILELFGQSTRDKHQNWTSLLAEQLCPFLKRKCLKIRKSQPDISIGSCSVVYGKAKAPIIICPHRFLERRQVFVDCLHLLTSHEPGNELHVVSEVSVPGGSVDYFLVSAEGTKVRDFVGIELQTMDTTGTVWPARQAFLKSVGVDLAREEREDYKTYGINWKMTAKTILIQLHHKVETFEAVNKHIVLVIQDFLYGYLRGNFRFSHVGPSKIGDPLHIHAYSFENQEDDSMRIKLGGRFSTDAAGIAESLGLNAPTKVALEEIVAQLESKISRETVLEIG